MNTQISETYKTINQNTKFKHEEKKSKFIAYTYQINSKEEIKQIIKQIKQIHPKSNHTPYAFRLGKTNIEIGFSDDGEPTGSAGKPIYFEIKGKKITNTLIIIARYFGGIKLGVGGLTKAFSYSAKQALKKTQIIKKPITNQLKITFKYNQLKDLENICKKNNIEITNKTFKNNCQFTLEIPINKNKIIKEYLTLNNIKQNKKLNFKP